MGLPLYGFIDAPNPLVKQVDDGWFNDAVGPRLSWIERSPPKAEATGSNPVGCASVFKCLARNILARLSPGKRASPIPVNSADGSRGFKHPSKRACAIRLSKVELVAPRGSGPPGRSRHLTTPFVNSSRHPAPKKGDHGIYIHGSSLNRGQVASEFF